MGSHSASSNRSTSRGLVAAAVACALWVAAFTALAPAARGEGPADAAALEYFEREVRPVLVDQCQKCHGAGKQESDLRLDSRAAALSGGLSGPAIVPGAPEKSLLVTAIRYAGDLKMPPRQKLTEAQIAALAHWIKLGAPWPETDRPALARRNPQDHWAFQPLANPEPPRVPGAPPSPIDAFIRARLAAEKLAPAPPADRRTLIRRATFDLLGLPPTPEEVEAFARDPAQSYESLVERLLESPHYGEQQARLWLDLARYSDTKGYVYAREQRQWPHAWVYRDWLTKAFNRDLPYDRFLLLQLAADQAAPDEPEALAAMGLLTLGRRFLGVQRDIIDDRIDVVTRGMLGLTVSCARCHDHKYDPIPTRDYYALYGVFQSCVERIAPATPAALADPAFSEPVKEVTARKKALEDGLASQLAEVAQRNRARAGDYLAAQLELHKYPEEGFDQILEKTDLLPNFVRRWQAHLAEARGRRDPVFAAWFAFNDAPAREFAAQAQRLAAELAQRPAGEVNPLVAERFRQPPASLVEVAARYGELFTTVDRDWQALLKQAREKNLPPPAALENPAAEAVRQVLYHPHGPCEPPREPIVNIEYYVDSAACNALWKLQNEYEKALLAAPPAIQHAVILTDRERPSTPYVFKRGNPANRGDDVPRQFLQLLAGEKRQPFEHGSGRLELAQAIIDPANPLPARVIVNRVWSRHFGAGLVTTPSDFGLRAAPPSHPELLDWLARRFQEDGWSLKRLHKRIMLSETYQQAGGAPSERDPDNRLLSRMTPRRLSWEELRDALLASAGKLDGAVGGKPGDLLAPGFVRRSLYGSIDRQFLPGMLRYFDFANPDLHIPARGETSVPQQALFFLNHPLALSYAQALAQRTAAAATPAERVQQLYRHAYQRSAEPQQVEAALAFIEQAAPTNPTAVSPSAAAWSYGWGKYDAAAQRVSAFERLPHFTGSAWQGGAAWPDAKLGWVQLTATGGHPGNDLAHAAIRRWTAPRALEVQIESRLLHEPKEGQGVRGFVVSSRSGLLASAQVHHGQAELAVATRTVQAGETLDFVADIGGLLSHNQFLWRIKIAAAGEGDLVFDSERDFQGQPTPQLSAWEQLAQVLLSANEFLFID